MTTTNHLDHLRAAAQAREEFEFETDPPRCPPYYANTADHSKYNRYLRWQEVKAWTAGVCGYCGGYRGGVRCQSCGAGREDGR